MLNLYADIGDENSSSYNIGTRYKIFKASDKYSTLYFRGKRRYDYWSFGSQCRTASEGNNSLSIIRYYPLEIDKTISTGDNGKRLMEGYDCNFKLTIKPNDINLYYFTSDDVYDELNNELPSDTKITIKATKDFPAEVYQWQYSVRDTTYTKQVQTGVSQWERQEVTEAVWENFPSSKVIYSNNGSEVSFSGSDLMHIEVFKSLIKKRNVLIRINFDTQENHEQLILAPILEAPRVDSAGSTYEQETCYNEENATVTLKFDRVLYDEELLYWGTYNEDGALILKGNEDGTKMTIDINPLTLKSQPLGPLPNGESTVGLFGTYRVGELAKDTVNTYVAGNDYRATFNIIPRDEILFSLNKKDAFCNAGADGEVTITATGGTSVFSAVLTKAGNIISDASFSDGSHTFTGLRAGEYVISLIDSNGCSPQSLNAETQTITINQPNEPLAIVSEGFIEPLAYGYVDGKVWAHVRGGTAPYSAVWKNSEGNILKIETLATEGAKTELPNISKGLYLLEVFDAKLETLTSTLPNDVAGCKATMSIQLNEPPVLQVEIKKTNDITCHGNRDGELTAHAIGGRPDYSALMPYKYEWQKVSSDGSSTILNYNSINDSILSELESGYYTVAITDTNNITLNSPVFYLDELDAIELNATQSREVHCYGGSDGHISVSASGGTGNYIAKLYRSDDADFIKESSLFSSDATITFKDLEAGLYNILIFDENNCEAQNVEHGMLTVEVSEPDSPLSISDEGYIEPLAFGQSNGKAWAYISGGTGTYTAIWKGEDGQTLKTENITPSFIGEAVRTELLNIPVGVYFLDVYDANRYLVDPENEINYNACVASVSFMVEEPPALAVHIEKHSPVICNGDNNGALVAHATGGRPDNSAQMPYTYLWEKVSDDGEILESYGSINDSILIEKTVGYYKVTATDTNNISAISDVFYLSQPDSVILEAHMSRKVYCHEGADGHIAVVAKGGSGTYIAELRKQGNPSFIAESDWFDADSIIYFTNLTSGIYEVYLHDENNCEAQNFDYGTQIIEVTQPNAPLAILEESSVDPLAFGYSDGKAWAYISGGAENYTATWTDSKGTVLKVDNLTVPTAGESVRTELSDITKGEYYLSVYDSNRYLVTPEVELNYSSCEAFASFVLSEPPPMHVHIEEYHYTTCYNDKDGKIVAYASGGMPDYTTPMPYKYEWYRLSADSTEVFESYAVNDSILENLGTGYYTVCITDTNQVQLMSPIFYLEQPEPLTARVEVLQQLGCDGAPVGKLNVIVEGGTPPYYYEWETGNTTATVSGLSSGIYAVFVRDSRYEHNMNHECVIEAFGEISFPNEVKMQATINNVACHGHSDGQIELSIVGGKYPYTYQWSNGATSKNIEGLVAGDYTVTVKDAEGCIFIDTYTVEEPELMIINIGSDITLCQNQSKDIEGMSNYDDVSYEWTKNGIVISQDPIYTVSEEGTYGLTIFNNVGCSAYDEVNVYSSDALVEADFIVPTEIAKGKDIQAVNITTTNYDEVRWILPQEANVYIQDNYGISFSIPNVGSYVIGMELVLGECSDIVYKAIEVKNSYEIGLFEDKQPLIVKLIAHPNPNDGKFSALVELSEIADYDLYLYNSLGILVAKKTIKKTKGTTSRFDISRNGTGVFFLRLVSDQNTAVFKVLVR